MNVGKIMTMPGYTAKDGLRLMMLTGVPLDDQERNIFSMEFDPCYCKNGYDMAETLEQIYAGILPFRVRHIETYEQHEQATTVRTIRDNEFREKLARRTSLREMLEYNLPFNKILNYFK